MALYTARGVIALPAISASCPLGNAFADGCPGSPSGTIQYPGLFGANGAYAGSSYVTRPGWNVPGVDYYVGLPTGTVTTPISDIGYSDAFGHSSIKTITTSSSTASGNILHFTPGTLPAWLRGGNTITISDSTNSVIPASTLITSLSNAAGTITISANVTGTVQIGDTIQLWYDQVSIQDVRVIVGFSSGTAPLIFDSYNWSGFQFYLGSLGPVTIQNCYFKAVVGAGALDFYIHGRDDGPQGDLTIKFCEIDGSGSLGPAFGGVSSQINYGGNGTCTIMYNYFHQSGGHIMETGIGTHGNNTFIYKYNLEVNTCVNNNTDHMNFTQMLGGATSGSVSQNSVVAFNTLYLTADCGDGAPSAMMQLSGNNINASNNVIIASPPSTPPGTGLGTSYVIDPGSAGTYINGTINQNFIDRTGSTGSGVAVFLASPNGGLINYTSTGNIDLVNGKTINNDNTET